MTVSALSPILSINLIEKLAVHSRGAIRIPIAIFLVLVHVSDFAMFVMAVRSEPHITINYPSTVFSPRVVVVCASCSIVVASTIALAQGINIAGIYTFSVLGMTSIFVLRLGLAAQWTSPAGGMLTAVYLIVNMVKAAAVSQMAKAANKTKIKGE
jgi:hypothetical protein